MSLEDANLMISYQEEMGGFPLERIERLLGIIATLIRQSAGDKKAELKAYMPQPPKPEKPEMTEDEQEAEIVSFLGG